MKRPSILLAKGKDKAVLRRHPWIFSGAVAKVEGNPLEGDIVDVFGYDGRWLAAGHYQQESIICKVLSFDTPDVNPEQFPDFWQQHIHQAVEYRRRMGFFANPHTNVFRLVHAEGDFLPGLVADYYNGIVVLQAHSRGMYNALPLLAEMLRKELPLEAVFNKSSATVPGKAAEDGFLLGEEHPEWEVCEEDVRLLLNFYEGQKTGFFIDQRENRKLVASVASGCRVLNCFGYTGGFSLGALKGGASYVETVDISRRAIDLCNHNVALNFGNDAPHKGVVADVLQYLDTVSGQFDVIILDPPAFAKSHKHLQHGLKGYRTINQLAMERIRPGGLLFTFSCSQAVSRDDFQTLCFTAAANARRRVRIVRQLPHALDHPVSIYHPEGEYLKGLMLYVE